MSASLRRALTGERPSALGACLSMSVSEEMTCLDSSSAF